MSQLVVSQTGASQTGASQTAQSDGAPPELTDEQLRACVKLQDFLKDPDQTNFLLLGPAGSGKTTVIVNAFSAPSMSQMKVVFCAFTNKATQVLRNISKKIDNYSEGKTKFRADFLTIHKLLSLEIKFKEREDEIGFTFDEKKMAYVNGTDIDVIVFDECSTISKELFEYIKRAWLYVEFMKKKRLKLIFLGDFWQLPPIGEDSSIVFESSRQGWTVAKLRKVMRAANEETRKLNDSLIQSIELLNQKKFNDFWQAFPYGIIPKALFKSNAEIIDSFFALEDPKKTTMVLTFSNANCMKINHAIQDFVDRKYKRDPPTDRSVIYFYPGDKCLVDRPIEVRQIKRDEKKLKITEQKIDLAYSNDSADSTDSIEPITQDQMCRFGNTTGDMIYNGEVLEILATEDIKMVTTLNGIRGTPKFFPAQLLYVRRLDNQTLHEIVHINKALIDKCRPFVRGTMTKDGYLAFMSDFYSYVPILNYGYCMTIYKAQGSEWDRVICNISSIEASIVRKGESFTGSVVTRLFKTTYTAVTRAKEKIICLYVTG